MKVILRLSLLTLAAILFAGGGFIKSSAQRGRDQFSHATVQHKKLDCNYCHKNPTANWATTRGYPDVADFPGHASCVACHRADFFRTSFCVGCHTNPGPRGAARFPFPVRSRSHEFTTVFPHSVHQDIISRNELKKDVAVAHFVNASFIRQVDDPPQFNNCAICHQTASAAPKTADRTPANAQPLAAASADSFAPKPAFFKDMPSGHAACFQCHYTDVKPTGKDCAGCHALTTPYSSSPVVKRYSLKFDHQQKEHAVRDCMTCHVRIAGNADLKTMKDADVPFMACVSCHNDKLVEESGKRAASLAASQPAFQCNYCHTTSVGRFPIPPSHK
jgi:hypothetical protein